MKGFRSLLALVLASVATIGIGQFQPTKYVGYGTYAGTNGGFNYLPDIDTAITVPHAFNEIVYGVTSGAESAWTRREGSFTSSQIWLKATTGTTSRSSCGAQIWYDFVFPGSRLKLDYVLQFQSLVWWDNVAVRVYDLTWQSIVYDKQTVNESGTAEFDVTPGHTYRLYLGLNQNNLAWYSGHPTGDTSYRVEGTLTPVFVPATLNIDSTNPTSGVPITVYTVDHNGLKNGTTPFTRTYEKGQTVSIGAPNTLDGGTKAFQRWEKDAVSQGAAKTLTLAMDVGHTVNAVYVDAYTLTVNSTNPGTGVPITVYQKDVNGLKDGSTFFNRIYKTGTTVSMTAPSMAGGNGFVRWEKDGVPMGTSRTISVAMAASHTVNAIYSPLHALAIGSINPASGVGISVWTADFYNARNGVTGFTRTYHEGKTVSLTAPLVASGNYFLRWELDGSAYSSAKTTTVTMNTAHALNAAYVPGFTLSVQSIGAAGVAMTVYQRDINGVQNGVTNFTRLYWQNLQVGVTAPASADGKPFARWEVDGVPQGPARTVKVTMAGNHTIVAVYQ